MEDTGETLEGEMDKDSEEDEVTEEGPLRS